MDAEGGVRTGWTLMGWGLGDPSLEVDSEELRGRVMGSCLNTRPRVLEMGLKRVYTLLRSWNRLEDFDQIFWGQKSALAGQWLPRNYLVAPFHYNPWSPWVLVELRYSMPDILTEA